MTILAAVVATVVVFALVVAGIVVWARKQAGQQSEQNTRQHYLSLASLAANDPSGVKLMELLNALETAGPSCPVTVQWLRHMPANKAPGMLIKITWDGNEWRRVMDWESFKARVRAVVERHPECGVRVKQLLADLEQH